MYIRHPNLQPNADGVPMFLDEDLEERFIGMLREIIEKMGIFLKGLQDVSIT